MLGHGWICTSPGTVPAVTSLFCHAQRIVLEAPPQLAVGGPAMPVSFDPMSRMCREIAIGAQRD